MSHGKERKEKNCLNCGAQVYGRYCHICGQENIDTHETIWGLITHFVYDITHFDGKFFSTLRLLLFKPGFLSKEYMRGRRASYLHPIKMYVFTSAMFFFILFASQKNTDMTKAVQWDVKEKRAALLQKMLETNDSASYRKLQDSVKKADTAIITLEELKLIEKDTSIPDSIRNAIRPFVSDTSLHIHLPGLNGLPATETAYDSLQASLSASERDGWFRRYFSKKSLQLQAKFKYQKETIAKAVADKFVHSLPQMMFVSLPFVAMLISLLYRRHQHSNYVHHGILTVHNYIAMYILILLVLFFNYLKDKLEWGGFSFAVGLFVVYMFYYNYKSLRNFFGQRRAITVLKFALLNFLVFILFTILSIIFVVNSLLSV